MNEDEENLAWQAVLARSRAHDGAFVFGVASTGVFCRPSCPARRPRPENVSFYNAPAQARSAGFRPCLRCQPEAAGRDAQAVAQVLSVLDAAEGRVSLEELGRLTRYSPAHLQRVFLRMVGLSPAAYQRAKRADALGKADSVTQAFYDAGYCAASSFYDQAKERMGMAPSVWMKGGAGVQIRWAVVETSLGRLLVAATDKGVCRIGFHMDEGDLRAQFPQAEFLEGNAEFAQLLSQVVAQIEMPGESHKIPLDVQGTAFQEKVWAALRQIPKGETRTYAQLAAAAGHPKASRAAGSANGANPVAVLVPCHRVIRADGTLGGYAWGEEIKAELLRREGAYTKE
jgi:AraC family transcriptional regulator of adaptative response/methylated-DNA-[protein]-cysteine methyltransferase